MSVVENNQKVGLEAAILERVRVTDHWSSLRAGKRDGAQTDYRYFRPSKDDVVTRRRAWTEGRL